jgi:hypothetical protein
MRAIRRSVGGAFESRGERFIRITVGAQQRQSEHAPWAKSLEEAKGRAVVIQELVNRLRVAGKDNIPGLVKKIVEQGARGDRTTIVGLTRMVDKLVDGAERRAGEFAPKRKPTEFDWSYLRYLEWRVLQLEAMLGV